MNGAIVRLFQVIVNCRIVIAVAISEEGSLRGVA